MKILKLNGKIISVVQINSLIVSEYSVGLLLTMLLLYYIYTYIYKFFFFSSLHFVRTFVRSFDILPFYLFQTNSVANTNSNFISQYMVVITLSFERSKDNNNNNIGNKMAQNQNHNEWITVIATAKNTLQYYERKASILFEAKMDSWSWVFFPSSLSSLFLFGPNSPNVSPIPIHTPPLENVVMQFF